MTWGSWVTEVSNKSSSEPLGPALALCRSDDAQLQRHPRVSGHAAPLTVPAQETHGYHCYGHKYHGLSRVHTGTRVLCLFDEARHVFQEEVVHVLLVHLPEFTVLPHVHLGAEDKWQSQSQIIFQTCTTCCWAFGIFGILWSLFVRIKWTMRVLSTWLYHQWDEWDWGRWGWHQTSPSLHLKSQAVALLMWRTGLPDLTRENYLWLCNDNDTDLKSWET